MNDAITDHAVTLAREALLVAMNLSLPVLLVGLVLGLVVSLFQTLTQLQEQTLTFIPKILGVGGTLFFLLPWMVTTIVEYTQRMFVEMQRGLVP